MEFGNPCFPLFPISFGIFYQIYLNFLSTTVLVSNWLTHAHFPISPPHFPLGLPEEGDNGMQCLQEGLVVATICIRQVPSHLHGPPAQVPRLNQVSRQPADHVKGEKPGESDRLEANMRTLALHPGTGRNRIGQSGKARPFSRAPWGCHGSTCTRL